MPFVNVKIIEGVITSSQKQNIVRKLADAMVEIEGEAMRPVTWVVVEELASGDWGIVRKSLTTVRRQGLGRRAACALTMCRRGLIRF